MTAKKTASPPRARKGVATGRAPRTKKAVQPAKPALVPESMTMVRVGDHEYPLVSDSRCHTCQSPHRKFIEREMLLGRSYANIADILTRMEPGQMPTPNARTLASHVRSGHTPQPAKIRRQIMDRRAEELGAKIIGDDSIVDHVTLNSLMLQSAHEALMRGDVELSASDINAIIKTRIEIEKTSNDGYETEVLEAALHAQMEATMSMLKPEQYEAYAKAVEANPVLRAALKKVRDAEAIDVPSDD